MRLMRADVIQQARTSGWAAGLGQRLTAAAMPMAFAAVLLVGAAVRGWGLTSKSVWFDEAYSVFVAQQPFLDILRLLGAYDLHPPLYYVFLHVWTALFGTGEVAVRFPSVIASVGVVALTFLLARRLAGDRVGLLAAALVALSPFQITAAQEARMYPILTLFGLGGSYALWLALEEGRRRRWIAYTLLMLLALYTHHFALLLLLAHAIYVLAVHRMKGAARTWTVWTAVAAIAYLPVVPMVLAQLTAARAWPGFQKTFGVHALTDAMGLLSFGGGLFGMGTYYRSGTLPLAYRAAVLLPFVLLVLCGLVGLGRRARLFTLGYWLLPIATIAVISGRWNLFQERYFSIVLPPFTVLVAGGVFYLADRAGRRRRTAALAGVLILLASFIAPALAAVYRDTHPYDWRGAAGYVSAQARADDFLLFIPAFLSIPFDFYFQSGQPRMNLSPQEVLAVAHRAGRGALRLRTSVPPDQMAAIARHHPRMWTISSIGLGAQVRLRIGQVLALDFREVDGRSFGLVHTGLWESRPYGRTSKP